VRCWIARGVNLQMQHLGTVPSLGPSLKNRSASCFARAWEDLRESTDAITDGGWLTSSGTLIFRLLESDPPRFQNTAFL